MKTSIKNPGRLQTTENGSILSGYNQDWYSTAYKRTRGCGPTVATMLLIYTNQKESAGLPLSPDNTANIKKAMELVWDYVTPNRFLGTNSTEKFTNGLKTFFTDYKLSWQAKRLPVPLFKSKRPSAHDTAQFIKTALENDCPVAFLNLQKGDCHELDTWHWMLITAIDEANGSYIVKCFDNGNIIGFDLGEWLKTSRFGGGFVYITK